VNLQKTVQKKPHCLVRNLEDVSFWHQSRFKISISYPMVCIVSVVWSLLNALLNAVKSVLILFLQITIP